MTTTFEAHWVQRPGTPVRRVHRPATVEQAVRLLDGRPDLRIVAGGTDLVVELSRERGAPVELLDVSGIEGFRSIELDGSVAPAGEFRLGGGVTHNDVLRDDRVRERALPLAQACLEIGSPQLRNRATIAGNVITASPANDSISALIALDAAVELSRWDADSGSITTRRVPVRDLFPGFRRTELGADELLTATIVPALGPSAHGMWVKLGLRKAQAISVVHAGLWVEFQGAETGAPVTDARIALGSVAPTVVLSERAREALVGRPLDSAVIDAAAAAAAADVYPIDDGRATADYRNAGVVTVVRRALHAIRVGEAASRWPTRVPTLGTHPTVEPSRDLVDDATEISVRINGTSLAGAGAASTTLLDWLREHAGTGTKEGCAEGECGACSVIVDGSVVMSCLMPAAQADGSVVTTIEGLADGETLSAMQRSFVDEFAVQCGYCIPGFVVAATALRADIEDPTRDETEFGLAGNLCRCTGYYSILEAVRNAGVTR